MEATIAMHDLILKHRRQDLLVMTAQGVVHGDLERHYGEQEEIRKEPEKVTKDDLERARKQEQSLLMELKVLKEWHNQSINHDKQ
jgi:hypothetical protein